MASTVGASANGVSNINISQSNLNRASGGENPPSSLSSSGGNKNNSSNNNISNATMNSEDANNSNSRNNNNGEEEDFNNAYYDNNNNNNNTTTTNTTTDGRSYAKTINARDRPRYKTRLCNSFRQEGSCRFGNACLFAHSSDELRKTI